MPQLCGGTALGCEDMRWSAKVNRDDLAKLVAHLRADRKQNFEMAPRNVDELL